MNHNTNIVPASYRQSASDRDTRNRPQSVGTPAAGSSSAPTSKEGAVSDPAVHAADTTTAAIAAGGGEATDTAKRRNGAAPDIPGRRRLNPNYLAYSSVVSSVSG